MKPHKQVVVFVVKYSQTLFFLPFQFLLRLPTHVMSVEAYCEQDNKAPIANRTSP